MKTLVLTVLATFAAHALVGVFMNSEIVQAQKTASMQIEVALNGAR